jgi:DnaJ-class molecular chaperone
VDYDLFYEIEIDILEAILGTKKEVNIPILGKRNIEIKSATQFGTTLEIS